MTTKASYVPQLEHFRARLDRAATLYENINTAWENYLEGRPHRLVTKMHSDGRCELLVDRVAPLPAEPMLLLGEFAYQLRAALDNCLYAVAIITSGTNPPPGAGSLQWPICDDEKTFAKQRNRLKHIPDHLVDRLEIIQPYKAELPAWNSLRLLNELARVDRNRALHDIALVVVDSRIATDDTVIKNVKLNTGALFDGSALVTFEYTGLGQPTREHIDGEFEFEVDIAGIELSPGPGGTLTRPWGTLARRLRSMHRAVLEYTEGLVHFATHPDEESRDSRTAH